MLTGSLPRMPRYWLASGSSVGTCAKCGTFAACHPAVNVHGNCVFLCGTCGDGANIRETGVNLRETRKLVAGRTEPVPKEFLP